MKKFTAITLFLALVMSLSACGKENTEQTLSNAVNVEVYTVENSDVSNVVSYTGTLKAASSASATSKVSGKVRSINAEIGDYVEKGTVLLTIDDTDYRLQYEQALASLNSAKASYNSVVGGSSKQSDIQYSQALSSAKTAYNDALNNYNRQKQLFDMGAVSKVALDSAETALKNAELALNTAQQNYDLNSQVLGPERTESAQAGVNSAQAAVNLARNSLANCTITAPISGYVASKNAQIGQMISPGMEIFSIKDTKSIEAEVNVTESVIPYITTETEATVSVKSADALDIPATVSVVNPVKNASTGMYTVRVSIPNEDSRLNDGMLADVSLVTGKEENVLSVPSEALMQENDSYYLYIANGNKAERKDVEIGISDDENTVIISGVKEGDKVIVSGKDYISEKNNEIKIVNE